MRRRRDQLVMAIVAGVLGLLVVAQINGQTAESGLSALSAQDLTLLIANLDDRNEQLRAEVAALERQLTDLGTSKARGESAVDTLKADLAKIRAWAGLDAVRGPGVSIGIRGPIDGRGVEDLLNELRNAGAEAISIGDVRAVPGVVVAGGRGALSVDDTPLVGGFIISAVGSPQILTGSLTRLGGVIAQLAVLYPDAVITVTPLESVVVPASTRHLVAPDARPRL